MSYESRGQIQLPTVMGGWSGYVLLLINPGHTIVISGEGMSSRYGRRSW